MNNFEFCNPVKVVFGKGSIARLSALLPEGSKVLVVYGGGSIKKNGIYEQVTAALKDFHTYEFGGIEANPRYETCMKAVELVKGENIDFLLAVGGGSVIDATKFIASATFFEGDPWDILSKGGVIKKALPLGVVLTLAATGSEMNERAVISRESVHEKLNFMSPLVFPKFAMVQDYFAEGLMKTIVEEGRKVLQNPNDYDIRANLMWAATNALNCWIGQGVPQDWSSHRMGYALTAQFGLDHAQTLAVILPGVMTYMRKEKAAKLIRMGEVIFGITEGSADEKAQKSIEATEDFFHFMGLKTRLSDYGIKESDLDALVEPIDRMGWKLGEYGNINSKVAKEILLLRL